MRPDEVIARMSQLAQSAAILPGADPALRSLLSELLALSRLLPVTPPAPRDPAERFDNMPV